MDSKRFWLGGAIMLAGCGAAAAGALLFGLAVSGYGPSVELLAMPLFAGVLAIPVQAGVWFLSRRSSTARRLLATALGAALCAGAVGGFDLWETSPRQLFKRVVMDPIPESVRVLHGREEPLGVDTKVMLHFKIDRTEFARILEQYPFKPEDEDNFSSNNQDPAWWRPDGLSSPIRRFVWKDSGASTTRHVWTNGESNEVYYLFVAW